MLIKKIVLLYLLYFRTEIITTYNNPCITFLKFWLREKKIINIYKEKKLKKLENFLFYEIAQSTFFENVMAYIK